uniref:Uncharacterized protein n=1 Tax=Anguilla anguilla TaxID=7936 RepID=A0A0E9W2Q6_ANGAN
MASLKLRPPAYSTKPVSPHTFGSVLCRY